MVTLALIQGVVNIFVMFFSRVIGHTTTGLYSRLSAVTDLLLHHYLHYRNYPRRTGSKVFWFSRQREFKADAAGARLAGGAAMIGALERLKPSKAHCRNFRFHDGFRDPYRGEIYDTSVHDPPSA